MLTPEQHARNILLAYHTGKNVYEIDGGHYEKEIAPSLTVLIPAACAICFFGLFLIFGFVGIREGFLPRSFLYGGEDTPVSLPYRRIVDKNEEHRNQTGAYYQDEARFWDCWTDSSDNPNGSDEHPVNREK